MLEIFTKHVKGTKDEVKKLTHQIAAGSPPSVTSSEVPKYEDYKHLPYWFESAWQAIRNKATKEISPDSSIPSLFMEDEHGEQHSEALKSKVRGDAIGYWNDMHAAGETPVTWTKVGLQRKDDFRKTFKAKYPWLRLCEAGWKVDHLWINYFKSWKRNHGGLGSPELTTTNPPPSNVDRKPMAHIDILSSNSSDASTKRQRDPQEENEEATKRPRTILKAIDIMAPTKFHHSRPQSKKMVKAAKLKLAKVSILSFNQTYRTDSPQDPLYSFFFLATHVYTNPCPARRSS